jgi:carboxypeptidase family protein/TonB-dependent receptor-like protein
MRPLRSRLPGLRAAVTLLILGGASLVPDRVALAQGVTTAAVQGTVRISDGSNPDGARVSVRNAATGFVVEAEVRNGRFLIQGLESGGPYSVTVRRIGALAQRRDGVFLSLGEPFVLRVLLDPAPVTLDSIVVVPAGEFPRSNAHGGTATTLSDSLVHHLPTLNRDVYDFVRLVPQISTRVGLGFPGMSGGGVGFRLNNFLTNGVPTRSLSGSQPPEFAGGKSLPFEAVSEYQVLLAPFDVRYGDFAGAAINTVTRAGTNRFGGSVFIQSRNDALARDSLTSPYERWLYGFSVSGPLRRDRAHFLIAAELQRLTSPMAGPYVGQPATATSPVPVREADLARLETIMRSYGLESGSGGAVPNRNPLRNVFARVDAKVPLGDSRAVVWLSDGSSRSLSFARRARDSSFSLTSRSATSEAGNRTAALQLHTALKRGGGGHNEWFLSYRASRNASLPDVRQPIVNVTVPSAAGGGVVSVLTGTPVQAQGAATRSRNLNLRDNLTLPLGRAHVANFGVEAEWFRLGLGSLQNAYGTWSFLSLDSLAAGLSDRFEVARDLGGAFLPISGGQYAVYAGDRWQLGQRVSFTLGARADLLTLTRRPPYNPAVDSVFGRRTDQWPREALHFSPRLGFTWDPDGTGRNQFRGGVGIFTGRPPLAWYHTPLRTYGFGTGTLSCGSGTQRPPPPFQPDPLTPPTACGNGSAGTPAGDVELLNRRLGLASTLRWVLAWDGWLPGGLLATAEALLTRNRSDFLFVNLNLVGPQSVDRHGRVLYGSINALGRAKAALRDTTLPSVIDLQKVSLNHSEELSVRLEKRFSNGLAALASYTWSRVRDVQTPLRVNNRGVVNWSSRALSGRHDDLRTGISSSDIPHRVVLAGTWRAPWRRWTTELSLLYVGESGSPFTYLAFGTRLGDLNADGSNANDPIYVPLNALDPTEILFTGVSLDPAEDNSPAAQEARIRDRQAAFEAFVEGTPCLRRQRGTILERNSCREPWSHTTVVSARQQIPVARQALEVQLDLYNLLNLLRGSWGLRRVANPALLEHVGQIPGPLGDSQPVFRFDKLDSPWTAVPAESAFQLQLGLRYRF